MKNNGEGEIAEIGEEVEEIGAGDKKTEVILDESSFDEDYKIPERTDNVRLLMTPGIDILNLLMRANIPNRRFAVALASYIRKCRKHNYVDGEKQALMLVAGLIGERGMRANLVSNTIIGEKDAHGTKKGVGDWIREKAGMGEH